VTLSSLVDRYQQYERMWCLCLYHRVDISWQRLSIICTWLHSVTSQKQTTCISVFTKTWHWNQMNPDHTFIPYLPRINCDTVLVSWYLEHSKSSLSSRMSTLNISDTHVSVALSSSPHVPELFSGNALQLTLINTLYLQTESHKELLHFCCNF